MRVVCCTVGAFIQNLEVGIPIEKTVWVDESRQEVSEHRFLCNFQASAVVRLKDGGEFLLQYGEDVGFDFMDEPQKTEGSEGVNGRRKYLQEYCRAMGLLIKPGNVSE